MLHENELFDDILTNSTAIQERLLYYTLLLGKRDKRKRTFTAKMRTLSGDIKRYRLTFNVEELKRNNHHVQTN